MTDALLLHDATVASPDTTLFELTVSVVANAVTAPKTVTPATTGIAIRFTLNEGLHFSFNRARGHGPPEQRFCRAAMTSAQVLAAAMGLTVSTGSAEMAISTERRGSSPHRPVSAVPRS